MNQVMGERKMFLFFFPLKFVVPLFQLWENYLSIIPYFIQVVEKKTKPYIQVDIGGGQTKTFAPEEISAMVLTKMKETAEAYLGKKVNTCVGRC